MEEGTEGIYRQRYAEGAIGSTDVLSSGPTVGLRAPSLWLGAGLQEARVERPACGARDWGGQLRVWPCGTRAGGRVGGGGSWGSGLRGKSGVAGCP